MVCYFKEWWNKTATTDEFLYFYEPGDSKSMSGQPGGRQWNSLNWLYVTFSFWSLQITPWCLLSADIIGILILSHYLFSFFCHTFVCFFWWRQRFVWLTKGLNLMPAFWERGLNVLYLYPSKTQMNRKYGSVAILVLHLHGFKWNSVTVKNHYVFRPQTLSASTRLFALICRISKKGGEASSRPRHSDNKLHRGRASGTSSEEKLHEHEQTCHSYCPVIPSSGSRKELAAEALSLHFLSRRGAWWEPFFLIYQARQHHVSSFFFHPERKTLRENFLLITLILYPGIYLFSMQLLVVDDGVLHYKPRCLLLNYWHFIVNTSI